MESPDPKEQLLIELEAYRELVQMIEAKFGTLPIEYRVEVFKVLMSRMAIKQVLGGLVDLPFQFADAMERRGRGRLDGA